MERLRKLVRFGCRGASTYPRGLYAGRRRVRLERNRRLCREQLQADSIIPAKLGKKSWKLHGVRAQMRTDLPRAKYARRSLIETVFSTAKRKLSCRAPGRTVPIQVRQHSRSNSPTTYTDSERPPKELGCQQSQIGF